MPEFPWPASGWPNRGDKVSFLNANGYPHQLEDARRILQPGQILTVKHCEIETWSSSYEFEELPKHAFNTVMFKWPIEPEVEDVATRDEGLTAEYTWL